MGMSTHIIGIKPPDAKWRTMKEVYDACKGAGVGLPIEVQRFFEKDIENYGAPDPKGVLTEIEEGGAVTVYGDDSQSGFEVDVTKLPPDVKIVRFYNSW